MNGVFLDRYLRYIKDYIASPKNNTEQLHITGDWSGKEQEIARAIHKQKLGLRNYLANLHKIRNAYIKQFNYALVSNDASLQRKITKQLAQVNSEIEETAKNLDIIVKWQDSPAQAQMMRGNRR